MPRVPFDDSHFTRRDLRIMDELVAQYRDTYSPTMIDVTHAENGAWAKIWQDGKGMNEAIPYPLGLDDDSPSRDAILEIASEYEAIRKHHVRPMLRLPKPRRGATYQPRATPWVCSKTAPSPERA